jgi:ubiquinone/menaquinone biosynthesis C-methylase UbiE
MRVAYEIQVGLSELERVVLHPGEAVLLDVQRERKLQRVLHNSIFLRVVCTKCAKSNYNEMFVL